MWMQHQVPLLEPLLLASLVYEISSTTALVSTQSQSHMLFSHAALPALRCVSWLFNKADDSCADARTYYSRLQANHGMDFAEAKEYRDNYFQDRQDRGVPANHRNGMYISSSIKDQGKTGISSHTIAQVS